jgi:phospholipase C
MLVISPYTRANSVSSNRTDTSSIIKFVEDNWLGGTRIGGGSFDSIAGNMNELFGGLFNFFLPHFKPVILDPTAGAVVKN